MQTSHFWIRTLAALAMLAAGAQTALAGPFEDGAAAYKRGDYQAAMAHWRNLSQTDATVMNNIGIMYMDGHSVPRNAQAAAQWPSRSAANGSSLGQNNLGGLFRDGKGVQRDYGKAMTFFAASAAQGNAAGQLNLGLVYMYGQGVRPDPTHAYMWLALASAQGLKNAQTYQQIVARAMSQNQVVQAHNLAQRCANQNFKSCG